KDSESLWRKTYTEVPGSMMANHNLGMSLMSKGDIDGAIGYLTFAAGHNYGKVAKVHLNLGKAYLRKKNFTAAMGQFSKSIALQEDFYEGYFYLGNTLKDMGLLDEARKNYYLTLKYEPLYFDAYMQLGQLEVQQGHIDTAIHYFEQVISINPLVMPAYYDMAALYIKLGSLDEAQKILEAGLRQDPGSQVLMQALELVKS
ncbi:MAG: tetratricopeptide repeat protein, partial [Patescibacteria group bacterium]